MERYRHELRSRRQKPVESLPELANEIERLSALGYPAVTPESRDQLFNLPCFLDAIADVELSFEVKKYEPKTLREALNRAMHMDMWIKAKQEKHRNLAVRYVVYVQVMTNLTVMMTRPGTGETVETVET